LSATLYRNNHMSRGPGYYIEQAKKRSEALTRLIKHSFEKEDISKYVFYDEILAIYPSYVFHLNKAFPHSNSN
jgi:hypothetical protein